MGFAVNSSRRSLLHSNQQDITHRFFPRRFVRRRADKFITVPKSELLFFSNTDPGFSDLLPRI